MVKRGLRNLLVLVLLALGAGYLGKYHPAGDSFAVFRPQIAVVALALSALLWVLRAHLWAVFGVIMAAAPLVPIFGAGPWATLPNDTNLSLYQKNMRFLVEDPGLLADDVLIRRPDFLTLQEVSGANMAVFDPLDSVYQYRQFCPFETVGGVAVASRWPIVPGTGFCAKADGLAAMKVITPRGPVWAVSVHLHWPWPKSQPAHIARLLPILERLAQDETGTPMVIGGDFNMVPWSAAVERIENASATQLIGPPHVTLTKAGGWMRVPIDHVMISGGAGSVQRLPRLGSDHFGLLARFSLPFPG
ncbi:endonuclease/exonuclease/phosphatase family protein [Aliiroseovarius sediminis]|uniref:endonuclease/exonuclease/phosphatase family protein n=1 Tax=Aliiroseovarius sediminis TaxID=2925839 RepID=UPI001F56FC0E|nr:endonuclease/exonuclease/phosphatase family protein [Aliiroseovarius sediminis]MCI2393391.1 endonuclease/exonuclease/phosphatase family protein [Aliiroseovarius sediminis]